MNEDGKQVAAVVEASRTFSEMLSGRESSPQRFFVISSCQSVPALDFTWNSLMLLHLLRKDPGVPRMAFEHSASLLHNPARDLLEPNWYQSDAVANLPNWLRKVF
jgi:hypothetical protein